MSLVYSTYEAKARFSEVIRHVRDGKTVTVSYRGEPVAEIRAIQREPRALEARLDELERQGIVVPSGQAKGAARPAGTTARRIEAVSRRAERMRVAYVDASVLVAIAFEEPGGGGMAKRLGVKRHPKLTPRRHRKLTPEETA